MLWFFNYFSFVYGITIYWMIITSLKTEAEISLVKPTFFPKEFAWENYKYILNIKIIK